MGNSSYFQFDDDNKTKYIYYLNQHTKIRLEGFHKNIYQTYIYAVCSNEGYSSIFEIQSQYHRGRIFSVLEVASGCEHVCRHTFSCCVGSYGIWNVNRRSRWVSTFVWVMLVYRGVVFLTLPIRLPAYVFNSLAPGRCGNNFIVSEDILRIVFMNTPFEIALRWMP